VRYIKMPSLVAASLLVQPEFVASCGEKLNPVDCGIRRAKLRPELDASAVVSELQVKIQNGI